MKYAKPEDKNWPNSQPCHISKLENLYDLNVNSETQGLKLAKPATRETPKPPPEVNSLCVKFLCPREHFKTMFFEAVQYLDIAQVSYE